ncbi:MAG TPA: SDR family oxidoreductase [Anaeromyxobacteraceae bacterium]
MRVLVTGATGYIGGLLVPNLLEAGHAVRVLARAPGRVAGRPWSAKVEVVRGDVLQPQTLAPALAGCDAAYYLVHSMGAPSSFHERDLAAAGHFATAAGAASLRRIVYLGGLGDDGAALSEHLASRHATGARLRGGAVPVTELRAAIVVGAGSVSFEMIRYLVERLPVMLCPRWVYQRVQPIAVRDVLAYLRAALESPRAEGQIVEIGGADVLSYRELMLGYAALRGLRRWLIPVPVLSPRLSSHWVHWMTPVPQGLARPLIEGLRSEVVVRGDLARRLFPAVAPLSYREALAEALGQLDRGEIETRWSDALATSQGDLAPVELTTDRGLLIERRQLAVAAPAAAVFRAFTGLGGARGWLYADWTWRLRGALDRLVGGVGLRRGRRDPDRLRVGDALDFWRVEEVDPPRLLRLRAEMKVPGRAWLQFEARPAGEGRAQLVQTAYFAPRGLAGHAYWYLLYPIHGLIFGHLARRLAARAEKGESRSR